MARLDDLLPLNELISVLRGNFYMSDGEVLGDFSVFLNIPYLVYLGNGGARMLISD